MGLLANRREWMAEDWYQFAGLLAELNFTFGGLLGFHWTKQHSPSLAEM